MRSTPSIASRLRRHASGVRLLPLSFTLALLGGCADPSTGGRCVTERECRPGQVCLDGRCGAAPACALDTDCPTSQICRDRACGARSCRDDGDCDDRRCLAGWCQPRASSRCADDDDCPAGRCADNGLCALDVCPPTGCAAGCAVDGDCPAADYCAADGLCRAGCRLDGCVSAAGAASSAALCDPESRRCVTVECAVDDDCPPEAYCADRVCRPGCRLAPDTCPGRCDRETRRCGCGDDGDCAADGFCAEDGVCRPGCRLDGCAEGECDPIDRRCVTADCVRDADCGPDRACGLDDVCHPARGPLGAEAPCAQPAQCASGLCADGRCLGRCAGDADCPSGRCVLVEAHLMCVPPPPVCAAEVDCDGATCRPWWGDGPPRLGCLGPVGEAPGGAGCADDGACRSGACVDGACWRACADDDDCPGACLPARLFAAADPLEPRGPLRAFAGCLDPAEGSGVACADDGGCPAGEACGLWFTGAGFEGRCRVATGGGAPGAACAVDGDCRARWCADGRCVAPCVEVCAAGACAPAALDDRRGGHRVTRVCGAGGEEP